MPFSSSSSHPRLDALRAEVRAIESSARRGGKAALPFGIEEIDRRLADQGLAAASLHEIAGSSPSLSDDAAATSFAAGITGRFGVGNIVWVLTRPDLFAPGLAQSGLPPERVVFAQCRSDEEVLAVMEEGLRHGGLAAVVGEVGRAAMASTRRLQLAAEEGGTAVLMLKRLRKIGEDPLLLPSSATTRWRIACVPSEALPVEGIGRPRWRVELVRQRGGAPHSWLLEGSDAEGRLALSAGSFDRSASAGRAKGRRAA